jgi:sRNA-binding carbon storage regulator CsrA
MLVITRKLSDKSKDTDKSRVVINHGGEQITLTLRSGKGNSVSIGFDGPKSFKVRRGEAEEKPSTAAEDKVVRYEHKEGSAKDRPECFVRVEGSRWQNGSISRIYSRDGYDYYDVICMDGSVMDGVLMEDVHPVLDTSRFIPNGLDRG